MFKIRFKTVKIRPDLQVTLRAGATGWDNDIPGLYQDDEWVFDLPEQQYPNGSEFKFVLERTYWMANQNLNFPPPQPGAEFVFTEAVVQFPAMTEVIVENSRFQQLFFEPKLSEQHVYDVLVIGSGIGGGVLADQLVDLGADVLVLEAGSVLFSTHSANLPRQHQLGQFDKHLWGLFDEYKVLNYVNAPGSQYNGGQAFNLGGRSVFWGGFIPRMTWWELDSWPQPVRWDLESSAYQRAEDLMYWPPPPPSYQQQVKALLDTQLPAYHHFDAPMAVRQLDATRGTLAPGLFSTADLLTEGQISVDPGAPGKLAINLNHAAIELQADQDRIVAVRGLTDHPVLFTHFSIPVGKPHHRIDSSSKTLSQHKQATAANHPYNVLLELGADLNHGRYLDRETLNRHRQLKGDAMLCEIVFLFNAPLLDGNRIDHFGPAYAKPVITMGQSPVADAFWGEVSAFKDQLIGELQGEPLPQQNLELKRGGLGGVAHEVGTLRMGLPGQAVVDTNLKFNGYENLYVCDLSVFPTSPAANPTLTLAALALRLADHLKTKL